MAEPMRLHFPRFVGRERFQDDRFFERIAGWQYRRPR
jgi:hypothetical protein